MILGIDEVGRGALAGAVAVGGVLLDLEYPINTYQWLKQNKNIELAKSIYQPFVNFKEVNDSKLLSKQKREMIYKLTQKHKIKHLVVLASNNLIDKFGLGVCLGHLVIIISLILSRQTEVTGWPKIISDGQLKPIKETNLELVNLILIENQLLELTPEIVLKFLTSELPKLNFMCQNKADTKFLAVAMASILAKVVRDGIMEEISKEFAIYNWRQNKGYGTLEHRLAIKNFGFSCYHRTSFEIKI